MGVWRGELVVVSHPGGVTEFLNTSCYGNWDYLQWCKVILGREYRFYFVLGWYVLCFLCTACPKWDFRRSVACPPPPISQHMWVKWKWGYSQITVSRGKSLWPTPSHIPRACLSFGWHQECGLWQGLIFWYVQGAHLLLQYQPIWFEHRSIYYRLSNWNWPRSSFLVLTGLAESRGIISMF